MKKQDKLLCAIRLLMDASRDSQLENAQSRTDSQEWFKEHCTVRVMGPKKSGHTAAIGKIAFEDFTVSAIICPTLLAAKATRDAHLWVKSLFPETVVFYASTHVLEASRFMGIQAVFVDCVAGISDYILDEVYKIAMICGKEKHPFFVVLVY